MEGVWADRLFSEKKKVNRKKGDLYLMSILRDLINTAIDKGVMTMLNIRPFHHLFLKEVIR
jgi:hypothetical protein